MPELPEVQAHCDRLSERFTGARLARFEPLRFTALKTAVPDPARAVGERLEGVTRRGKYLMASFGTISFVVHLMQGGRLRDDMKPTAKPGKLGQARWTFDDGRIWMLTEAGTERKAGVWCVETVGCLERPPLDRLGPDALSLSAAQMAERFAGRNMRVHGFLRDQGCVSGLGRLLANEICHAARLSPFAMTGKLGAAGAGAVVDAIHRSCEEALAFERTQDSMSSSAERPAAMHNRTGQPCPDCGDTVREVSYSHYRVNYCPTCQTGGQVLADNTTSRFLK
jgi:formamidopyrimidine-DNA glycosylase